MSPLWSVNILVDEDTASPPEAMQGLLDRVHLVFGESQAGKVVLALFFI